VLDYITQGFDKTGESVRKKRRRGGREGYLQLENTQVMCWSRIFNRKEAGLRLKGYMKAKSGNEKGKGLGSPLREGGFIKGKKGY